MAEVIGTIASALTVAALFKTCIEAFDLVRASQRQESELRKLSLRLNIEKCRLYTWGEAMGLTRPQGTTNLRPLDSHQFCNDVVKEALRTIIDLFHDSQKIKDKYGCREADLGQILLSERDESSTMKHLAASFGNFKVRLMAADSRTRKTIAQRSLWVIHDCEKFHGLIREVKDLIDGVQDITKGLASIARQDHMIKSHVMRITDEETLDMVSDVCEIDHPSIADAATARADTISMATTKRLDITDWTTTVQVDTEQSDEIADLDVESLTITELKHIIRSGLKRNITTAEDITSLHNSTQNVKPTLETSDSAPQSPTSPGSPLGRSELDLQYFEEMQQEMATAKSDQDFMAELNAIQSWFDVLSSSERFTTLFVVNRSVDSKQQRLLAQILSQISASPAPSSNNSKEHAMPNLVAGDMSKLNIDSPSRSVVDSSAGLQTSKEKKDHGNFDLSAIFTMFPDRAPAAIAQDEEFVKVVKKTRSWGR